MKAWFVRKTGYRNWHELIEIITSIRIINVAVSLSGSELDILSMVQKPFCVSTCLARRSRFALRWLTVSDQFEILILKQVCPLPFFSPSFFFFPFLVFKRFFFKKMVFTSCVFRPQILSMVKYCTIAVVLLCCV